MNWYKQLKLSFDFQPDYTDIGHNEHGVIWGINQQWEFFAKDVEHPAETHGDLRFDGGLLASGRYDTRGHIASLEVYFDRRSPDYSIMYEREAVRKAQDILKRKFGNPKIFVYDN